MRNECRLLNLSVITKQVYEDCVEAEISLSYKELIQSKYQVFNVMKTDAWDQIKRIKAVKLYPGKLVGKDQSGLISDVVGGIQVIYELKNGQLLEDGLYNLKCTNLELKPTELELKENEYITSIYGTGTDFIKTLIIETNFYRKLKQGSKKKSEQPSPRTGFKSGSSTSLMGEVGGLNTSMAKLGRQGDSFSIHLPGGAKVLAFGGTGDEYFRSIFAYYKI